MSGCRYLNLSDKWQTILLGSTKQIKSRLALYMFNMMLIQYFCTAEFAEQAKDYEGILSMRPINTSM